MGRGTNPFCAGKTCSVCSGRLFNPYSPNAVLFEGLIGNRLMFITVIREPQSFLHRIRAHSDLFCLVAKIDKMGYDKCRNPTAESGTALIPLFGSLVFEGKSVWSA